MDMDGRVALVTGASAGLGAHFAQVLAAKGAHVVMAARRADALAQIAERIAATGGSCETLQLDIRDSASIASAASAFARVDVLINNAGVVREAAALDTSEEDWDQVVDTNLKGMFVLSQRVARALRERAAPGVIVNIASILGLRQAGGVLSYAVSKAGVVQLTKSMALELARFGIRVNALAPGYIETDLNSGFWDSEAGRAMLRRIPQRRLGRLEDLNGPLLLLASDASAYMTGAVLAVDGGHLVSSL